MRLLLHNPNTDRSLTARLEAATLAYLGPSDSLVASTADRGVSFIGSEETIATARQALTESLPSSAASADAVLLGCFGDLGVDEIRTAIDRPLISLSDACFMAAASSDARLALLTTSAFWADRFAVEIERRGIGDKIVAVRPMFKGAPPSGDQLMEACRAAIAQTAKSDGVDAVVLAGAPLVPLRDALLASSPMPIFDLLGAGLSICRSLAARAHHPPPSA